MATNSFLTHINVFLINLLFVLYSKLLFVSMRERLKNVWKLFRSGLIHIILLLSILYLCRDCKTRTVGLWAGPMFVLFTGQYYSHSAKDSFIHKCRDFTVVKVVITTSVDYVASPLASHIVHRIHNRWRRKVYGWWPQIEKLQDIVITELNIID